LAEVGAEWASRKLVRFTELTNPLYSCASHHVRIAEHLEAVERGDIDRLMIFMPPRHGKSELASRRFPAWCLGRDPTRQIIAASYNSDLASDFGRDVRNIVASEEFAQVFPSVGLRPDSKAANRMNTNHGGSYIAAGVGTAVTGRGAHIALIDDPLKDREEADSEVQRNKVWAWYQSTLFTRLMPKAAIILIQTRWHEDDLAGRLLEQNAGEWTILDLPAVDEQGKALWPEWYDIPALERIKATIGPREWSALYQQRPQPDEGTFFQREWLKEWTEKPKALNVYGTSDYAVTEEGGDFDKNMSEASKLWNNRSVNVFKKNYKNTDKFIVESDPKVVSNDNKTAKVKVDIKTVNEKGVEEDMTVTYILEADSKGKWKIKGNTLVKKQ